MDKPTLLLASASPRRRELLTHMGITFTTHPQDVDETFLSPHPRREARRIARLKIESLLEEFPEGKNRWCLGADTFIAQGRRLLGKPAGRKDAEEMPRRLGGRRHKVLTGMALHMPGHGIWTKVIATTVVFRHLKQEDLEWYLDTGEWRDAAGAYKIQGAGSCLIDRIIGSYPNVMGLPIESLYGILRRYNFPF